MNGKRPGGWVALAWRYWRDPKFDHVSDGARLLWIDGLCYAGEQETDGRLPGNLRSISGKRDARTVHRWRDELVDAGLWERTPDGGYAVPFESWNRWQETSRQRTASRARATERQARWRSGRRVTDAPTNGAQGQGQGQGQYVVLSPPAPGAPLARPPEAARGARNGQAGDPERINVTEEARRANPEYEAALLQDEAEAIAARRHDEAEGEP